MERMQIREWPLRSPAGWARRRAGQSPTWAGLAMVALALGSEPMAAHDMARAIALLLGGGMVILGRKAAAEEHG